MLLKELRLHTKQLSALFNFYADVLQLPVIKRAEAISVIAGNSEIIFEKTALNDPFYHFAFNVPSNKFEEAFEWAKERVELLWLDDYKSCIADFVNWHAKSFYFKDP